MSEAREAADMYPWTGCRTVAILEGQNRTLDFLDNYIPDHEAGLLGEPGWICCPASDPERELFLSSDGVLYEHDEQVGEHLGLAVHALQLTLSTELSMISGELAECRRELEQLARHTPGVTFLEER